MLHSHTRRVVYVSLFALVLAAPFLALALARVVHLNFVVVVVVAALVAYALANASQQLAERRGEERGAENQ